MQATHAAGGLNLDSVVHIGVTNHVHNQRVHHIVSSLAQVVNIVVGSNKTLLLSTPQNEVNGSVSGVVGKCLGHQHHT